MGVRVGLWRKLNTEELMLLNCGVGEDSWESLGLQGDPTIPSYRRSVLGVHRKDWCWSWNSQYFGHLMWKTDSLEKTLMLWKIEGKRRMGRQRMRWLDGITDGWKWVSSRSWWWTGKPGVLQSMGFGDKTQSDTTEQLNWTASFKAFK